MGLSRDWRKIDCIDAINYMKILKTEIRWYFILLSYSVSKMLVVQLI